MASQHRITLLGIGVPVEVRVTGDWAGPAVRAAERAWGALAVPHEHPDRSLEFTVGTADEIPAFLDALSTRVTLQAIEEHSGTILLLHAAGLAHPERGAVVACVAPSGTGKTTLSTAAAGTFHYVSDETVAVAADGHVLPYPKPLSVKQQPTGAAAGIVPKDQRNPLDLGLRPAPRTGLTLGGIVLLDRLREGEPDTGRQPRLEPVELIDAIIALVPEMSYLGRMSRPLHRVAEAILRTGGAHRLVYRDAGEAVAHLAAHHPALTTGAAWDEGAPAELEASAATVALWEAQFAAGPGDAGPGSAGPGDAARASRRVRATAPLLDTLVDPASPRALVFARDTVSQVSTVAAATLLAARQPVDAGTIRAGLVRLFDEPPAAADGTDPFDRVLDELVAAGLLTELAA